MNRKCLMEEVTGRTWPLVDPTAGPLQCEAPHPILCPWNVYFTHPGGTWRTHPWESNMSLRPSGLCKWSKPVKPSIETLEIPPGGVGAEIYKSISLAAAHLPIWSGLLFLWLPSAASWVSDCIPGNSWKGKPTHALSEIIPGSMNFSTWDITGD